MRNKLAAQTTPYDESCTTLTTLGRTLVSIAKISGTRVDLSTCTGSTLELEGLTAWKRPCPLGNVFYH